MIHQDGLEAINFLKIGLVDKSRGPAGIIFLDLKLPGCDGFDVLKMLKGHPELAHVPVIVCTSSIEPEHRMRCQLLGADHFVAEPYELAELDAAVAQAVLRYRDQLQSLV